MLPLLLSLGLSVALPCEPTPRPCPTVAAAVGLSHVDSLQTLQGDVT